MDSFFLPNRAYTVLLWGDIRPIVMDGLDGYSLVLKLYC